MSSQDDDEPLVPWKEIAAQSIDRTEALEAERDGFRAEVGLLLLSVQTFEAERNDLRAENARLRELHDRHCAFKDCRERTTPHTSIAC